MKKGKISNLLFIIACIILVPILLVNVCIIFKAKTNSNEVPSVFGIKPFIVLSGSMEEEIRKGDLIITKTVDATTLKVDDVIAFRDAENTVTTHRIIDIVDKEGKTYFITKGDNNKTQDLNLVAFEDVEGIYIMRIPGIGSIMKSLSEPMTLIVIIFGITVIFGISFAISMKKASAKERAEFLEYKKMLEEKKMKENLEKDEAIKEVKGSKKTSTKKPSKK